MTDLVIIPHDSVYDQIACEDSIAQELYDYFSFQQPDAEFIRRKVKRLKYWDGMIRLFQRKRHKLYAGLRGRVQKFADDRGYTVEIADEIYDKEFSVKEALDFIATLKLPFVPHDHQIRAFVKAVRKGRLLTLSPTASGKSLIIYMLMRYLDEMTLIIVPTINLVDQMIGHFKEYGYDPKNIKSIYGGQDKFVSNFDHIVISTWQSIYEFPNEYFNVFGTIVVDEAHHAQASSIKHIMESATRVDHRYGFTGTLDDTPVHRLVLEGLFGEVHQVITTDELIKQGHVADLEIKVLILKYPDEVCQRASKLTDYADELEFIVTNPLRKRYLNNLILSLKGNTITLFRLVDKHGKVLYNDLKALNTGPTYFIAGETEAEERELIRKCLATQNEVDLVGSYGCVSTGFDAPSLSNAVLASPYKSKIKVLQSIGRGLRKHGQKKLTVIDIVDDLSWKKRQNFALKHSVERMKIYAKEFPEKYKIYKVKLDGSYENT